VIDLRGQVVALQAAHERAEWQEAMQAALARQLPLLHAWHEQEVRGWLRLRCFLI